MIPSGGIPSGGQLRAAIRDLPPRRRRAAANRGLDWAFHAWFRSAGEERARWDAIGTYLEGVADGCSPRRVRR